MYLRRPVRRLPKSLVPRLLARRALSRGTPLCLAATHSSEKVIDMLLDAGTALELEGGEHGTPLMGACAAGCFEVVKILVSKGAKISYVRDGQVVSALSVAKQHAKVIRWLLVGRFADGPRLVPDDKVQREGL